MKLVTNLDEKKITSTRSDAYPVQNLQRPLHSAGRTDKVDDDINSTTASIQCAFNDILLMVLLIPVDNIIAAMILSSQQFVNRVVCDKEPDILAVCTHQQKCKTKCPQSKAASSNNQHVHAS